MNWGSKTAITCLCLFALVGCQGFARWENRYGPDPELGPRDVEKVAQRQRQVMRQLSGMGDLYPEGVGPLAWYEITLAGFNYIDEKCDIYLHDVFIRGREARRTSSLLTLSGGTTSAILTAADASKEALEIVMQLFGLATGAANTIAESYLFKEEPSIVYGTAKKMRHAYRDDISKKYSTVALTEASSYALIRGYLAQCMPENIETEIKAYVAAAAAGPKKPPETPATARAEITAPAAAPGSTPSIGLTAP